MIKFFRHIRQRMIKENRVSKYLLYAIGEIALVMIGILLALQVNTWNEGRKQTTHEQKVLKELLLIHGVATLNTSAYDNLKSIGFDLISNDHIAGEYEVARRKTSELIEMIRKELEENEAP